MTKQEKLTDIRAGLFQAEDALSELLGADYDVAGDLAAVRKAIAAFESYSWEIACEYAAANAPEPEPPAPEPPDDWSDEDDI